MMNQFSHGLANQVTESDLNSAQPYSASILRDHNRPNPLICDDAANSKMSSRRGSTRFTPYDRHSDSRKRVSWADGSSVGDNPATLKKYRHSDSSRNPEGIRRESSITDNKLTQTAGNVSGELPFHDTVNSFEGVKSSLNKISSHSDLNHKLDMDLVEPLLNVTAQFKGLNITKTEGRLYSNTRVDVRALGIEDDTFHVMQRSLDASRSIVERNVTVGGLDAILQSLTSHSDENEYNRETVNVMNDGDQFESDVLFRGMYLD